MTKVLLSSGYLVFSDKVEKGDILIENQLITDIQPKITLQDGDFERIDVTGLYIFPGIIDSHVHFREPGLTHKATFRSESKAAVAGGITSVIDMPNTIPFASSTELIKQKKELASKSSLVNIGFFVGAEQDKLNTLLHFPKNEVAGIKVFLGSSTSNIKIEDPLYLETLFANTYLPIVVHAESETIIQKNLAHYHKLYQDNIPFELHSVIRSREACIEATKQVITLARKYQTSLHVLHVSTAEELDFFDISSYPKLTAEVCIPHLWFDDSDFAKYGGLLKCNPSVKSKLDKETLRKALMTDKVYNIATDHAPHTFEEKQNPYLTCPSGTTSIQHSLLSILELYHLGYIDLPTISKKMAENPAKKFHIIKRGQLAKGCFADLTIVNLNKPTVVTKQDILYQCKWSVFEGFHFRSSIEYTFVNGAIVYKRGKFDENHHGILLEYYQ